MRDALLGLFAGSWKDMESLFHVSFMTRDAGWVAAMRPKDRRLAGVLHALVLEGRDQRLTALWVVEQNGNWTHDTFAEWQPAADGKDAIPLF
jgi:hypothetical protein